jgi:hypothetical protein
MRYVTGLVSIPLDCRAKGVRNSPVKGREEVAAVDGMYTDVPLPEGGSKFYMATSPSNSSPGLELVELPDGTWALKQMPPQRQV